MLVRAQVKIFISLYLGITASQACLPCLAAENWKDSQNAGFDYDTKADYANSAAAYKKALLLLPANEDNERLSLQSSLGVAYSKSKKWQDLLDVARKTLDLVERLQKQHRLDPNALDGVEELRQACTPASNILVRGFCPKALQEQLMQQSIALRQAISLNKSAAGARDVLREVRELCARREDVQAEKDLTAILDTLKPTATDYWQARLALASLRAKHGHAEELNQAEKELKKQMSEPSALIKVAEGQYWVADTKGAAKTLDRVGALLGPPRKETMDMHIQLEQHYSDLYFGADDFKNEEPHCRKVVELMTQSGKDTMLIRAARAKWSLCLKHLLRYKEAASVSPNSGSNPLETYQFMLTDEEKKALERAKAHPGQPTH